MRVISCGYKLSETNPFVKAIGLGSEDASTILFAGWISLVFEDQQGQVKTLGDISDAEKELLRSCSRESIADSNNTDLQPYSQRSVRTNMFFGWNALQGYLAPDGRVVALCPENTISNDLKYIPRIVYPTALDVASSGPSTDYCTIAIDYSSRALYHWTFSNPVARALSAFGAIADHDFIECNIRFTRVWAGEAHFLALDQNGILYSWGSGRHGQLGHGDLVSKSNPQPVESLEGIRIVDAACGAFFSVALSEMGDIYTFGLNDHGQLGIGDVSTSKVKQEQGQMDQQYEQYHRNTAFPQLVDFFEGIQEKSPIELTIVKVACGHSHIVVLDDGGRAWSCGWGKYGQLGQDESSQDKCSEEEQKMMLRSRGHLTMQEDQYFFWPVTRHKRWSDVHCGRWSTFLIGEKEISRGEGAKKTCSEEDPGLA